MKQAKIFLAHSIRNKQESKEVIPQIIETLKKGGYIVFSDHVTGMTQQQLDIFSSKENIAFHRKIFQDLHKSNLVISECSKESLSVGFLLAYALEHEKPLIVLFKSGSTLPNLFPYLKENNKIYLVEYASLAEIPELVSDYTEFALENIDTRLNFYISADMSNYLKWKCKRKGLTKSAYLRLLLEDTINKDTDF